MTELIYISLYKQEYQKYNPDQDQQIKQLAENHGRQMEYLQLRNQDLEKQRQGRHCIFLLLTFLNKLKKVCLLIFIYIYFIFVLLKIYKGDWENLEIKVGRQEGRTLASYWPSCGHRKSGTRGRWMTWNASFTTLTTKGSTSCRFTS